MATNVTDIRSGNAEFQIAHAAKAIGRSRSRQAVFAAIYKGKRKAKTIPELMQITNLSRVRVLQEGEKLHAHRLIEVIKIESRTAYQKDLFYNQHWKRILRLAQKAPLGALPSRQNPNPQSVRVVLKLPTKSIQVKQLTVDDIQSFIKVRNQKSPSQFKPIREIPFKNGIRDLLGELGEFQDWGGEPNDLFSTNVIIDGKRISAAFGFKGMATKGKLTPKKMGKNGDQITRLFNSPASLFIVQYWGQIDQSILDQLKQFAIAKSSLEQTKIYYGVIDGADSRRLIRAYPQHFKSV